MIWLKSAENKHQIYRMTKERHASNVRREKLQVKIQITHDILYKTKAYQQVAGANVVDQQEAGALRQALAEGSRIT